MFLTALFRTPVPIVPIEPPAPASWLARLARATGRTIAATNAVVRHRRPAGLSAAGAAVDRGRAGGTQSLPPARRGTGRAAGPRHAAGVRRDRGLQTRDWFLLAEAAAIDRWIAAEVPGWCLRWRRARARARAATRLRRHVHAGRYRSNARSARFSPPIPWRHRSAQAATTRSKTRSPGRGGNRLRDAGRPVSAARRCRGTGAGARGLAAGRAAPAADNRGRRGAASGPAAARVRDAPPPARRARRPKTRTTTARARG